MQLTENVHLLRYKILFNIYSDLRNIIITSVKKCLQWFGYG